MSTRFMRGVTLTIFLVFVVGVSGIAFLIQGRMSIVYAGSSTRPAGHEMTVTAQTQTAVANLTATQEQNLNMATALANSSPTNEIWKIAHDAPVLGARWNADHSQVISWDEGGTINIWDANTGDRLLSFDHGDEVGGVCWNKDETRLLSWSNGAVFTAKLWDTNPSSATFGDNLLTMEQPDNPQFVESGEAIWNPDETMILTWSRDGKAYLWDANTGDELAILQHASIIWTAEWNQAGTQLLTASTDETARVWDMEALLRDGTSQRLLSLFTLSHDELVWGATWNFDETMILTWSMDDSAQLWNAQTGQPIARMPHDNIVWSALWSKDGQSVITSAFDGTVRTYDVSGIDPSGFGQTIEPIQIVDWGAVAFTRSDLNPENQLIASKFTQGLIGWNLASGVVHYVINQPGIDMQWSEDGRYLLTWGQEGAVKIWGGIAGDLLAVLPGNEIVNGGAWREDNHQLLVWSLDGSLSLWDTDLADPSATVIEPIAPTPNPTNQDAIVSATPRPPVNSVIHSQTNAFQSFIADEQTITAIDLEIMPRDPLVSGGDLLNLLITIRDGLTVSESSLFAPADFNGWLRFEFPDGLNVVPGDVYILNLSGTYSTRQKAYFGWIFDGDVYLDGASGLGIIGENARYLPYHDFRFRINSAEDASTLSWITATPSLTPSSTPTHTPIPPPLTATAEYQWHRIEMLAGFDPRTSHNFQVEAGGMLNIFLGIQECCYFIEESDIEVTWSVDPATGATIDPVTGVLTVSETVGHGVILQVIASTPLGSRSRDVIVYDKASNPLVGIWQQDAQISCETGEFVEPDFNLHELIFLADGRIRLTYFPFEVYFDYGGEYVFDLAEETLILNAEMINYLPRDIDGEGTFSFDDEGRLVLQDIWLGSPPIQDTVTVHCGHRFVRVG